MFPCAVPEVLILQRLDFSVHPKHSYWSLFELCGYNTLPFWELTRFLSSTQLCGSSYNANVATLDLLKLQPLVVQYNSHRYSICLMLFIDAIYNASMVNLFLTSFGIWDCVLSSISRSL